MNFDITIEQHREIIKAIREDNRNILKKYLNAGLDIFNLHLFNGTYIEYAFIRNNPNLIDFLLNSINDLDNYISGGETPLTNSIKFGSFDIVKILLEKGCSPHKPNNAGITPLEVAINAKKFTIVNLLIEYDVKIDNFKEEYGCLLNDSLFNSPIIVLDMVQKRIIPKALIHPNVYDKEGNTPLMIALCRGEEYVNALLQLGADVNFHDIEGCNPLYRALCISTNHINMLLKYNVKIIGPDGTVKSILSTALSIGDIERFKLLYKNVQEISQTVKDYLLCENLMMSRYDDPITNFLLSEGADLNGKDENGVSILSKCMEICNEKVINFLLNHNVEVNCKNLNNEAPLLTALTQSYEDIAIRLIKHGADISQKNVLDQDALHLAIYYNRKKIIKYFIEENLKITLFDKETTDNKSFFKDAHYEELITPLYQAYSLDKLYQGEIENKIKISDKYKPSILLRINNKLYQQNKSTIEQFINNLNKAYKDGLIDYQICTEILESKYIKKLCLSELIYATARLWLPSKALSNKIIEEEFGNHTNSLPVLPKDIVRVILKEVISHKHYYYKDFLSDINTEQISIMGDATESLSHDNNL
jgi:ankyrin repeat protein